MPQAVRLRHTLAGPVSAVKLRDHVGSSLKSPTETLINIPAGAVVELQGEVQSGLVNVRWNEEYFSVFYDDLGIRRD